MFCESDLAKLSVEKDWRTLKNIKHYFMILKKNSKKLCPFPEGTKAY